MLAEALLRAARLGADVRAEEARADGDGDGDPGDVPASALDSLWACLGVRGDARHLTRARSPRRDARECAALYRDQSARRASEGAAAAR